MRIIVWGINYGPEPTGIAPYTTGLAEHLAARAFDVTVVTGFPYYPSWKKSAADRAVLYRAERKAGVNVYRCWQYVPRRLGTLARMLHEASFVLTSFLRVLFLPAPHLYIVVSPPLGLGMAARIASALKRSRYLLHVQDLQPDSAAGLGMMRPGLLLRSLYACERFAYRGAAAVAGISEGMTKAFAAKGVPADKILLLPNWSRNRRGPTASAEAAAEFRNRHRVPAWALLAVYSGNLGRKQGLDVLLDAAAILTDGPKRGRPVVIMIAGEGAGREALARRLAEHPLARVRLLPLQDAGDYAAMMAAADLALITQVAGTGQVCFPSKLLSCLAAGLPVVSVADESSDLALAVIRGGFGQNVPAGDARALARTLQAAGCEPTLLAEWAARTAWVERYAAPAMLARFEQAARSLGGAPTTEPALSVVPDQSSST